MKAHLLDRLLILLSWLGVFVAGTLTSDYYLKGSLLCRTAHCSSLGSASFTWFGLPIALYGLVAYLILVITLGIRFLLNSNYVKSLFRFGCYLSGIASTVSIFLITKNLTSASNVCWWCFASTLIFLMIFLIHIVLIRLHSVQKLLGWINETLFYTGIILAFGGVAIQIVGFKRQEDVLEDQLIVVKAPSLDQVVSEAKYFKGSADAKVTIIEFGNFYCPDCKRAYHFLEMASQRLGGRLRLGFCHLIYTNSPSAELSLGAARIAELASTRGKYRDILDGFFDATSQQMSSFAGLLERAFAAGLPINETQNVLMKKNPLIDQKIQQDLDHARALKILTTPAFLIYAKEQPVRLATSATIKYILTHPSYSNLIYSNAN